MDFRILVYLCLIFCGSLGCYQRNYESLFDDVEEEEIEEVEEVEESAPPPKPPAVGNEVDQKNDEEEGFDQCPEVTYVLWENEYGVKYTVTLDVFCEPIPVFNLGCPAPDA